MTRKTSDNLRCKMVASLDRSTLQIAFTDPNALIARSMFGCLSALTLLDAASSSGLTSTELPLRARNIERTGN
jgi:hypothetical protein